RPPVPAPGDRPRPAPRERRLRKLRAGALRRARAARRPPLDGAGGWARGPGRAALPEGAVPRALSAAPPGRERRPAGEPGTDGGDVHPRARDRLGRPGLRPPP